MSFFNKVDIVMLGKLPWYKQNNTQYCGVLWKWCTWGCLFSYNGTIWNVLCLTYASWFTCRNYYDKINRFEQSAPKGTFLSKEKLPFNYSGEQCKFIQSERKTNRMPLLSQPVNTFSVTSLLRLFPFLQHVLNLVWEVANEHCEACIYTIRFQEEEDM